MLIQISRDTLNPQSLYLLATHTHVHTALQKKGLKAQFVRRSRIWCPGRVLQLNLIFLFSDIAAHLKPLSYRIMSLDRPAVYDRRNVA